MAKLISAEKAAFLKFELENGDARRKKTALQDITRLYRCGSQLNSEGRNAFSKLINGMVLTEKDIKVVRWCLNALARFGIQQESSRYVELSLQQYEGTPEIIAAAVAALSRMYNGDLALVPSLNRIDPVIKTLASLQIVEPTRLDLSGLKINIDTADVEVLKLALITVGLNRDINNLFDPRHSNGQIVKVLCSHDDSIVRQYSVWSVIENNKLNIDDLGINLTDIEKEPPNVQAKLLQLVAEQERDSFLRHDTINRGSYNQHQEAREGLAKGILNTYYDGLEQITISWFDNEPVIGIKEHVAEHFGRFAGDCRPYEDKALSIVEIEPLFKKRILLGAEGKRLYGLIKASDIRDGTLDMFGTSSDLSKMFTLGRVLQKERKIMKVLFLAASPKNSTSLRLDQEARDLKEQLYLVKDHKVDVDVEHRWAVRTNQVQMEMLNVKPTVLHFSGHGGLGALIFEDTSGQAAPVEAEDFAELVSLSRTIGCLVLNACYSESVAKQAAKHVDAVIGCDDSINDDAAIAFTQAFYRALAHGRTFKEAFDLATNDLRLNGHKDEAKKYIIISR